jgi:electron transfer flavoprotein alpha subunit
MLRTLSKPALRAFTASTGRSASTLVIADHDNATLGAGTLNTITAATALGGDITVLVAGADCDGAAAAAAAVPGVTKVLKADDASLDKHVAENVTAAVVAVQAAHSFTHILAPSSNTMKNFVPRVGAALDVAPLSDVLSIVSEDTVVRGMYAGNILATVQCSDAVKLMTVRTTAFEAAAAEGGSAAVEDFAAPSAAGLSSFVSEDVSESDRPDLGAAPVVIAGGRGMKDGDNFEMLYTLADKLGGAVGASRAAVDAGFAPNELQVGQTGKVVAPDLYVAVGISGAIQHLAGMKDSKTIVAINKDAEAPIFQVADYGLVADLFDAVPDMTSKV